MNCPEYQGFLWQHTAHFTERSFFTEEEGKFITIVGGCKEPQSPWKDILEYDINKMEVTNKKTLKFGLVSHDSFVYKGSLVVHGGSTGGDFNR